MYMAKYRKVLIYSMHVIEKRRGENTEQKIKCLKEFFLPMYRSACHTFVLISSIVLSVSETREKGGRGGGES